MANIVTEYLSNASNIVGIIGALVYLWQVFRSM